MDVSNAKRNKIRLGLELSSGLLRAVGDFNEALVYDHPSNMLAALAKIHSRADEIVKFGRGEE